MVETLPAETECVQMAETPVQIPHRSPRWGIKVGLFIAVCFVVAVWQIMAAPSLKTQALSITAGTPGEEVIALLGEPDVSLNRMGNRGEFLCWVDQFTQLDVLLDTEGKVESVNSKPSDSTVNRLRNWIKSILP